MTEPAANDRSGGSPYRGATATLGELREVYLPQARQLRLGYGLVGFFSLLLGLSVAREVSTLGTAAEIRADLAKLGDSALLGALLVYAMLGAVLGVVVWSVARLRRVQRYQRVRFHEHGIELVGPDGVPQQCRYAEIADVTRLDVGRGVRALRIERAAGAAWIIPPMFEIDTIAARLLVAQRRARAEAR